MIKSILCLVFHLNKKILRRSGVYKLLAEDFLYCQYSTSIIAVNPVPNFTLLFYWY